MSARGDSLVVGLSCLICVMSELLELRELRELRDVNYVWIRGLHEVRLGGCPAWEKAGELLLPRCGRAVVAELWASSCCRCVGELLLP